MFTALISSKNVVNALIKEEIDIGVMAIKNNIGGIVNETRAVLNDDLIKIKEIDVDIHHCLFVKHENININQIKFVASHEQALMQTKSNLNIIFKNVKLIKIEDTALGAKRLKNGNLSDNYAVVCSMQAGLDNKLHLIKENIEDRASITTFGLFKLNKYN